MDCLPSTRWERISLLGQARLQQGLFHASAGQEALNDILFDSFVFERLLAMQQIIH
jgi:hypothetical protein